jgi:hypothetical protein
MENYESKVYLEPIKHVYINKETDEAYKSVTKVISSIEPHFDEESIAEAISKQKDDKKDAIYVGLSKEQIIEYWHQLNFEANEYGTFLHNTLEDYLRANKWYFPDNELQTKIIRAYDDLKIDEGIRIYPERIMFSEEYKLAGTSDLIIDIDDVYFDVLDYKTNKKFDFYNHYGYQTLLPPFDHLQSCQYSVYSIQLSTYALMYEMESKKRKCRQIKILYWDKKIEKLEKGT